MVKIKSWEELEEKHPELLTLRSSMVWPKPEIKKGWYNLIDQLMTELRENNFLEGFRVDQIKQKFSSLRFYCYSRYEKAYEIVRKYEELSEKTCEECGKPGKFREYCGRYYTRCDKCFCDKCFDKIKGGAD